MAIASNIFKQLIYVPEGATIGKIDANPTPSNPTFTGNMTVGTATLVGDDEVSASATITVTGSYLKGTKITFAGDLTEYFLAANTATIATGTPTTFTLLLDKPVTKAITATTVITITAASPNNANQPRALRRVSSNLAPKVESYSSNEIRQDQQTSDYRLGSQTVDGTLACEMSSRTYEDFFAALLRKDFYSPVIQTFTAVSTKAPTITLGTLSGTTVTMPSGLANVVSSDLTSANIAALKFDVVDAGSVALGVDAGSATGQLFASLRVGDVILINPAATTASHVSIAVDGAASAATVATWEKVPFLILDKDITNYQITIVAAINPSQVAFTIVGAGSTTVNMGASLKIQVLGRKSFIPLTGHVNKSFQFEHYYDDISPSSGTPIAELFTGCRITQGAIKLPTSGITTCDFSVMGIGAKTPADSHLAWDTGLPISSWTSKKPMMYTLSGSEAVKTSGIDSVYSSAVGNIYFRDKKTGYTIYKADAITSFDMTIQGNGASLKVVGSTTSPDVTLGKIGVSGGLSFYFKDNTVYNSFKNGDELSLISLFSESSSNSVNSAFMNFSMPRVKLGSASKDDAQSIVLTTQYQALVSDGTNGFEATTIVMQDYAQLA